MESKTFQPRTHYSSHEKCFLFKTNATYTCLCKAIYFGGNPLINILCVVMLVAGCEVDVILVRMKSLPSSLGYFGSVNFLSDQAFVDG